MEMRKFFLRVVGFVLVSAILTTSSAGSHSEMPRRPVLYDLQIYRDADGEALKALAKHLQSNRNALPPGKGPWPIRGCFPKIEKFKDMTFNSPLVKFEDMTYEEKLLLWGYPADGVYNGPLHWCLAQIAYGAYATTGKWDYDVMPVQNAHLATLDELARRLAGLISPVTGKLIEVNHPEFSPGNAWVRIDTEEEVRELVRLDPAIDDWWEYSVLWFGGEKAIPAKDVRVTVTGKHKLVDPTSVPPGEHYPFLVYVRLYGEKGVLFEGLV